MGEACNKHEGEAMCTFGLWGEDIKEVITWKTLA
jgi:hypothetical protein